MTLIVAWIDKNSHIALACDGKGVRKHEDGSIEPVAENLSKL